MANLSHLSTMLVVEDEAIIALDIESTLHDVGVAHVLSTGNAGEALRLIGQHTIDAAVLDLHLGPNHWTYDIARALEVRGIPYVFSSGTVDIAEGFEHLPLVTKPFSTDQLVAALLLVTADRPSVAA